MTNNDLEMEITRKLVRKILAHEPKLMITVGDEEDYLIKRSRDFDKIIAELGHSDENDLIIRSLDNSERLGAISLIWGNGEDVISDHTDNKIINQLVGV